MPPTTRIDGAAAPAAPGSTASLRVANQQRVLGVLRQITHEDDPVTQADLARRTGLAPATVSGIVRELDAARMVTTEPGRGRRGTTVRIARSAGLVAGVDFGHSHLSVAVADLTGTVLAEVRRPLHPGHDHRDGLALARQLLDGVLAEHTHAGEHLRAVGLGLPAPITDGVVRSSAILPGWVGIDAAAAAGEAFGAPVHTENDANLGALAEHRRGVARGTASSVFVKISSGVGAGIVLEDRIFRGSGGTAGEVGHLTLDEQGPVCRCGSRGCLEAYASIPTIQQMMAGQLPDATLDDVVAAARGGNVAALRSFEDAGLHLGWGVASVVNLLNPDLVVIGGELARAGDLLLDSVRLGLRRHALDAVAATPVLASTLGERASLVGAAILAAEQVELLPG
ncbi:ROK family transcriptional regulator [Nocardioides perillae]|uniref:Putative NBD/HSP70 family sugar kinase n=1 Tax=Nocardioides perillae TaxID=1119534 RepID=A0A7Y9UM52_9ACTN|nr:ROK family transcriptional regulator [Nocardioides perillae]NYG55046.1 putative NBD/HSP70 family sugar kinase [Nocardioides perillae]